jgi:hypothetical protein
VPSSALFVRANRLSRSALRSCCRAARRGPRGALDPVAILIVMRLNPIRRAPQAVSRARQQRQDLLFGESVAGEQAVAVEVHVTAEQRALWLQKLSRSGGLVPGKGAPVSRARRSPVGFRRKLPYESPVCSGRQRHGLGRSGDPRSPSRQLDISGLQLRRLESRVWSLYCCFARIRRTVVVGRASNQPGGVVTLSRRSFVARFRAPANQ